MHSDLTYTMLQDMIMKKFKLEANYPLNLFAKLPSFDDIFDITNDSENEKTKAQSHVSKWTKKVFSRCYSLPLVHRCDTLKGSIPGNKSGSCGIDGNNQIVPISFGICKGETAPYSYVHALSTPVAYNRCDTLKGSIPGNKSGSCGIDGNNQIVPISFGICKGETTPCWSSWMSILKECICDNPNLLFIYDRHAATALETHNEFPLAFHVAIQPDAYHKLIQVGPQRWSRAHCPLTRYNYMTSNIVESVISCTVLYRKLPVLKLAETYHSMVQEWYFKRQEFVDNMTSEITEWVANKVNKKGRRAPHGTFTVLIIINTKF
nr:hypothetical protein [Tanacetum cinerariifolium]